MKNRLSILDVQKECYCMKLHDKYSIRPSTLNKALLLNHLKITIINYLVARETNIQLKMKLNIILKAI